VVNQSGNGSGSGAAVSESAWTDERAVAELSGTPQRYQ
jgi:hypothetical protein